MNLPIVQPLPQVLVYPDDWDPVEWYVQGHHRPDVAIAAVRAHLQELVDKGERDSIPPLGRVCPTIVIERALDNPVSRAIAVTRVCDLEAL